MKEFQIGRSTISVTQCDDNNHITIVLVTTNTWLCYWMNSLAWSLREPAPLKTIRCHMLPGRG